MPLGPYIDPPLTIYIFLVPDEHYMGVLGSLGWSWPPLALVVAWRHVEHFLKVVICLFTQVICFLGLHNNKS